MRQQFVGHGPPFVLPHSVEVLQGVFERLFNDGHFRVGGPSQTTRFRRHAGQRQHLAQQEMGPFSPAQFGAHVVNLLYIGFQRDFVNAKVLRPVIAVAADMDKDGSPADMLADDLFEFRLEHRIGLGAANGDLEMAIVDGAHFHAQSEFVALEAGFAESGHAQQHKSPPSRRQSISCSSGCNASPYYRPRS